MRWTLLAAIAAGAIALVSGPAPGGAAGPRVELVDGSLSLQNSLEGQAVFSADDIGPGHSASGTVTLTNAGTLPGDLTLSRSDLSDTPGPGGSPLSGQLQMLVQDLSAGTTV